MPKLNSSRILAVIALLLLGLALPCACAQEDSGEIPLGDVARNLRKKNGPPEIVIDNDNFSKVVTEAESHRAAGTTMTFTLEPGEKSFRVSTPDASCTLSFTAKASALLSDPMMLDELPKDQLAKLDGPATMDGDWLQLSIHNGSAWELREVVIGLTIVRSSDMIGTSAYHSPTHMVPAVATPRGVQDPTQKLQDTTILLHVKGSAAPSTTALFRTQLNFALFPDQEWHWAIVRAKGVPPSPPTGVEIAQPAATPALPPAGTALVAQPEPSPDAQTRTPTVPLQTSTQPVPFAPPVAQSPASNQ